ncbi:GerW family sporulation protein [Alicyclobacillus tolerans]|uniref:Sporulation protein YtfJ n=2 Tax=Alicyclobacillus tolerans TaxID=90970 RepID=A0A1M6SCL4_9BACL|nr:MULTISPECIES: GerW family sporulation protein [Alicyclobacillus]MDP9728671.1 sporulation protein YtfJ [Alicyclobacillus tengchongensis]QRF23303.1 sporulation protein YtfJ [Alicyclobacillus sp. TC]SHK42277.1 sporulation protein YtfJ [Alicyclobacillus montanus]
MEHPIQGLMQTAMANIREMVDVNTIIGDPVETPDGTVILPVSKVGFGFAAGGSEFSVDHDRGHVSDDDNLPFGGGSGGGVSITPIGFLIVHGNQVRLLSTDNENQLYDRLMDMAPIVMEKIQSMFKGSSNKNQGKSDQTPVV